MGVVRREGDWRLEKKGEEVYEITFQGETQLKVFTSDASSRRGQQPMFDTCPTREVSSYSEVEGLFEEKVHGPPPMEMSLNATSSGTRSDGLPDGDLGEGVDLPEVPPGGFGAVLLLSGAFILYSFWEAANTLVLLFGFGLTGGGLLILAYAGYLLKTEGWREAWEFLATPADDNGGSSSTESSQEKTPRAPEQLRNELFFERANRHCEYCGEEVDQPDVHHIKPRSEGGPNIPSNLIVLCPNCHRKADNGLISQSKLKYRVEQQPEVKTD